MSDTKLYPPARAIRQWGPTDDLPIGTPRTFGPSAGKHLTLATFPPDYEYARALAKPHLYDERDLEAMHENYLITHGLTEWPCSCGHTNLTPDAEFSSATPCESCGKS